MFELKDYFFGNLKLDLIGVFFLSFIGNKSTVLKSHMTAGVTVIIMVVCSCLETNRDENK